MSYFRPIGDKLPGGSESEPVFDPNYLDHNTAEALFEWLAGCDEIALVSLGGKWAVVNVLVWNTELADAKAWYDEPQEAVHAAMVEYGSCEYCRRHGVSPLEGNA